ncbi:MAG: cytidylate kinase-like family protein [Acidobacteriaceae bacterium]|nr:cytidylate kinase-like family protein [Acidobacteriaceae bacterium]
MTNVIVIEREYGCGAGAIARSLANRLGWSLWDRELCAEIAKDLNTDVDSVAEREERLDPAFYSLVKVFMRGSYEERYHGKGLETLDAESLSHHFERVINDVASRGDCVIVGRAAPWFLRDRPGTFSVFLYAPQEDKIRRVMGQGKSRREAEHLVEEIDKDRAAFVKKYYGKNWPTRELYHLMLNTKIGNDNVIKMILTEIDLLDQRNAATA